MGFEKKNRVDIILPRSNSIRVLLKKYGIPEGTVSTDKTEADGSCGDYRDCMGHIVWYCSLGNQVSRNSARDPIKQTFRICVTEAAMVLFTHAVSISSHETTFWCGL